MLMFQHIYNSNSITIIITIVHSCLPSPAPPDSGSPSYSFSIYSLHPVGLRFPLGLQHLQLESQTDGQYQILEFDVHP